MDVMSPQWIRMSTVGKGSRYAHLDVLEELGTRVWVSLMIQMRVLTVGGVVVVDMVLEVSVESGGLAVEELLWRKLFMGLHGNCVVYLGVGGESLGNST